MAVLLSLIMQKKSRFSGTELFQNDFVVRCNALDVRHLEQLETLGKALDDVGADVITTVFENAPRESGGCVRGTALNFSSIAAKSLVMSIKQIVAISQSGASSFSPFMVSVTVSIPVSS